MKIYLASSWRNVYQPSAVIALRDAGHEVYDFRNPPNATGFQWESIDPDWKNWTAIEYRAALRTYKAHRGFFSDMTGMLWADVGILLLPSGRSAHLKLGWMAGTRKQTIIWTRDGEEPELMALMATEICVSLREVLNLLEKWQPQPWTGHMVR